MRTITTAQPQRWLHWVLAAALLAGCSSTPKTRAPAKLAELTPSLNASRVWKTSVGDAGGPGFAPVVAGDALYAAAANGKLVKVDAATGDVVWRQRVDGRLAAGPGADGNVVVVANRSGQVFAFDANGVARWTKPVNGEVLTAPAVAGGLVVVRTTDNRVTGLDAADGRQRWVYQREPSPLALRMPQPPVFAADGLVLGFAGGKVGALAANDGALRWEAPIAYPKGFSELDRVIDVAGAPAVRGSQVCVAAFQAKVACLALRNGAPAWQRDFDASPGVALDADHLYAVTEKSEVAAFAAGDGTPKWRNDTLTWRSLGPPAVVGRAVAFGDFDGYVHLLSRQNGEVIGRLKTDGSPITTAPVLAGRLLIVATGDGNLYAFEPQ